MTNFYEEMEAEFNAQYDYAREAYAGAVEHNATLDAEAAAYARYNAALAAGASNAEAEAAYFGD